MSVWVVYHRLNVLVVTTNKALSPESNGEVSVSFPHSLCSTSTSQTVCGFGEVGHICEISFVVRTRGVLVVDQKFHVWRGRFLEATDLGEGTDT